MNKRKEWKDYDIVRPEDAQRWEDKPDLEEVKTIIGETAGSGGSSEVVEEVKGDLDEHINDKNNPHEVTAEQVNAYTKEVVDQKLMTVGEGVTQNTEAIEELEKRVDGHDDRLDHIIFVGTKEEYEALDQEEKEKYLMWGVPK